MAHTRRQRVRRSRQWRPDGVCGEATLAGFAQPLATSRSLSRVFNELRGKNHCKARSFSPSACIIIINNYPSMSGDLNTTLSSMGSTVNSQYVRKITHACVCPKAAHRHHRTLSTKNRIIPPSSLHKRRLGTERQHLKL